MHRDEFFHAVRVSSPANYASGPDEYGQHSYDANIGTTATSQARGMQGMRSSVEYFGIGTTHSYSTQPYSISEAQVKEYRHTTQHSGVYGSAMSHAGVIGGVEMPVSGGRCEKRPTLCADFDARLFRSFPWSQSEELVLRRFQCSLVRVCGTCLEGCGAK
jgi:hypothetical protein